MTPNLHVDESGRASRVQFWLAHTQKIARHSPQIGEAWRGVSGFENVHSEQPASKARTEVSTRDAGVTSFPADIHVLLKADIEALRGAPLPREFPPCVLARGEVELLARPTVAIVGSRAPTMYGRRMAAAFATELAAQGVAVLSGGALGIDGIANKAALAVGRSCAVVGGGLCDPHPRTHHPLFDALVTSGRGLLISQFPEDERARAWHFPKRNVTLALLADFVLIVEASLRSGSLITASAALDAGVDLGALPGELASPLSQGTNALIADGAFCIRRPSDILERLVTLRRMRAERETFMGMPQGGG